MCICVCGALGWDADNWDGNKAQSFLACCLTVSYRYASLEFFLLNRDGFLTFSL